jgi:hypothetical protein
VVDSVDPRPGTADGQSDDEGDDDVVSSEQQDAEHEVPPDVDESTVSALGLLSEALETTERARGHLYSFHQLTGTADFKLGEAADELAAAGHSELAEELQAELIGRNVVAGRWTFQIVEDYDDNYWGRFRDLEQKARDQLAAGRRHLHEAQLKEQRRTHGKPGHAARPQEE